MPEEGNGIFLQALNITDFIPIEAFTKTVQEQIARQKSSRKQSGISEILIPGEPEFRTAQQRQREGIPLADTVWAEIVMTFHRLGATVGQD